MLGRRCAVVLLTLLGLGACRTTKAPQTGAAAKDDLEGPAGPSCEQAHAEYVASTPPQDSAERSEAQDVSAAAYGAVLSHGAYFLHCDVPDTLDISICAAIQHGAARGVTVQTNPVAPRLSACIDRAVRRLRFPPSAHMDLTRTFFAAEGTPPWGRPRKAPDVEARVLEFLRAAPQGVQVSRPLCAKVLVAMPGFWKEIIAGDAELAKHGTSGAASTDATGAAERTLRIFEEGPELEALLASPGLASFATRLAQARIRPASAEERELTYRLQMVAFTADTPVTVAELGELRVAFLFAEGRLYWVEVLSEWKGELLLSDPSSL